jgi:hypothetical protein
VPDVVRTPNDLRGQRLRNSRLAGNPLESAESVVRWLCAVQSQDYAGAKWAIGQRAPGVTDSGIDRLFNEGVILRTHVLRPTWHFVLPADIRWMLRLSRPRVKAALAYYDRILEIDERIVAKSSAALTGALQGGTALTRAEIAEVYQRTGLPTEGQRVGHLLMHAELDGVICSGGLRGRRFNYALLDERAPQTVELTGDAALAELAARYFASHGPAQLRDFAWWSGLAIRQARSGVELAAPTLHSVTVDGSTYFFAAGLAAPRDRRPLVHLLPNWDEYLVGYADRSLHVDAATVTTRPAPSELLANSIVVDGRIIGGWRRAVAGDAVTVTARPRVGLTTAQAAAIERSCDRYGRFAGKPVRLLFEPT